MIRIRMYEKSLWVRIVKYVYGLIVREIQVEKSENGWSHLRWDVFEFGRRSMLVFGEDGSWRPTRSDFLLFFLFVFIIGEEPSQCFFHPKTSQLYYLFFSFSLPFYFTLPCLIPHLNLHPNIQTISHSLPNQNILNSDKNTYHMMLFCFEYSTSMFKQQIYKKNMNMKQKMQKVFSSPANYTKNVKECCEWLASSEIEGGQIWAVCRLIYGMLEGRDGSSLGEKLLGMRFLKDMLLRGSYGFYVMGVGLCFPLIRSLYQLNRGQALKTRAKVLLTETLSFASPKPEEQVLGESIVLLCDEITEWFAEVFPNHPFNHEYKSIFLLFTQTVQPKPQGREFTFFTSDDKKCISKYQQKYGEGKEQMKSYVEELISNMIVDDCNRSMGVLHRLLRTGDSGVVELVIEEIKDRIANRPGSDAPIQILNLCKDLGLCGEVEFITCITSTIIPEYFPFIFQEGVSQAKISEEKIQILQLISTLNQIAIYYKIDNEIFHQILMKVKFWEEIQPEFPQYPDEDLLKLMNREKSQYVERKYKENIKQTMNKLKTMKTILIEESQGEKNGSDFQRVSSLLNMNNKLKSKMKQRSKLKSPSEDQESCKIEEQKLHYEEVLNSDNFRNKLEGPPSSCFSPSHDSNIKSRLSSRMRQKKRMKSDNVSFGSQDLPLEIQSKQRFYPVQEIQEIQHGSEIKKEVKHVFKSFNKHSKQIKCSTDLKQSQKLKSLDEKLKPGVKLSYGQTKPIAQLEPTPIIKTKSRKQNNLQNYVMSFTPPIKKEPQRNNDTTDRVEIIVEPTIRKPPFGFKTDIATMDSHFNNTSISQSISEIESMASENPKALQNFAEILKQSPPNADVRVIENEYVKGYVINPYKNREKQLQNLIVKLNENNKAYEKKIVQKDKKIDQIRQNIERQKQKYQAYQKNLNKAYDNVNEGVESLLLSSNHYEQLEQERMEEKVRGLKRQYGELFEGFGKKVVKQILYGKCLLFKNREIQIGYTNDHETQTITLYYTFHKSYSSAQIKLQTEGWIFEQQPNINLSSIPQHKQIKFTWKIFEFDESQTSSSKITLMKLHTKLKQEQSYLEHSPTTNYEVSIPFCLYGNFIKIKSIVKGESFKPMWASSWQLTNEELHRNGKEYMGKVFKVGEWVDDNSYHLHSVYKGKLYKLSVLFHQRYFCFQGEGKGNPYLINTLAGFLVK